MIVRKRLPVTRFDKSRLFMNLIFFGSSEFSLEALKACLASEHQVQLVITTPPQKKGRGLKLTPTVVQEFCEKNHIPFEAYATLKNPEYLTKIKNLKPDLLVVSSYGKLIPSDWLKVPAQYALNVHPSLLPKYRGASPLNWPIINGDSETGISIAEVTPKLDAGDIFYQEGFPLTRDMNSDLLSHKLAELSKKALQIIFEQMKKGPLHRTPQNDAQSTYARKLEKEDAYLDLTQDAITLESRIRGLKPWPGSSIQCEGEPLKIIEAVAELNAPKLSPGTLIDKGEFLMAAGKGALKIKKVQPAGKKEMSAADFLRGKHLEKGFVFTSLKHD